MVGNVLLLLFVGLTVSGHAGNVSKLGDPICPCITLADAQKYNKTNMTQFTPNASYGISCDKHDAYPPSVIQSCALANQPLFCASEWCYVDPGCPVLVEASTVWIGRYYSYSTCGYIDTFASHQAAEAMKNQQIRIAKMHNSGGWKGAYCRKGRQICDGPLHDAVDWVLIQANAKLDLVASFDGGKLQKYPNAFPRPVMNQVWRNNPNESSTFTACVIAAGMGYVDICIGAFVRTASRVRLAHMVPVYSDPVFMIAPSLNRRDMTFWNSILRIFHPFKAEVWPCIIGFIICLCLILAFLESSKEGMYAKTSAVEATLHAVYTGFQSLVDSEIKFPCMLPGGRFIALALGFFVLLTVSSYTANLASLLIVRSHRSPSVESWDAVLTNENVKVCAQWTQEEFLVNGKSLPKHRLVPLLRRSDIIENIGTTCDVAVISGEDLDAAQQGGRWCHIQRVGEPLYSNDWAVPVSAKVSKAVSLHWTSAMQNSVWDRKLTSYRVGKSCVEDNAGVGMDLSDFAGGFAISVLIASAGVMIHFAAAARQKLTRQTMRKKSTGPPLNSGFPESVVELLRDVKQNSEAIQAKLDDACAGSLRSHGATKSNHAVQREFTLEYSLDGAISGSLLMSSDHAGAGHELQPVFEPDFRIPRSSDGSRPEALMNL